MIEERRDTIEIMMCSSIGGFCTHEDCADDARGGFSNSDIGYDDVFVHRPGLFDRFED